MLAGSICLAICAHRALLANRPRQVPSLRLLKSARMETKDSPCIELARRRFRHFCHLVDDGCIKSVK